MPADDIDNAMASQEYPWEKGPVDIADDDPSDIAEEDENDIETPDHSSDDEPFE